MSHEEVLLTLKEVFPQVDTRILKAVAIEHHKDIDTAVDFLVTEVLPSLSHPAERNYYPNNSNELTETVLEAESSKHDSSLSKSDEGPNRQIPIGPGTLVCETTRTFHSLADLSTCSEEVFKLGNQEAEQESVAAEILKSEAVEYGKSNANTTIYAETAPYIIDAFPVNPSIIYSQLAPPIMNPDSNEHGDKEEKGAESTHNELEKASQYSMENNCLMVDNDMAVADDGDQFMTRATESDQVVNIDTDVFKDSFSVEPAVVRYDPSFLKGNPDSSENAHSREGDAAVYDNGRQEPSKFYLENTSETLVFNDDTDASNGKLSHSTTTNRSDQFLNVDILDDFINDAKSSKKTLTSGMDVVVNLVKEAELREEAAHRTRVEASEAGLDILTKAEDLKNMLAHANDTNDMHAGEVYGEKSILATEARELHARLLSLADKRDKSLSIIEEMRRTLEARIVTAEAERLEAEEEKLSKEDEACKVLAEQEKLMDKLVQESQKLHQQAEENSKLREFLVDRGRIIDMIQGEIAVICEDIMSLKESVDGRVSFQEFLQSRPTSLTSSTSSRKSLMSDKVPEAVELSDGLGSVINNGVGSQDVEGPPSSGISVDAVKDSGKASCDDEWDLLDA